MALPAYIIYLQSTNKVKYWEFIVIKVDSNPLGHHFLNFEVYCMSIINYKPGNLILGMIEDFWHRPHLRARSSIALKSYFITFSEMSKFIPESGSDNDIASIWRDFQYQLIYHLLNKAALKNGKSFIFYGGTQHTSQAFRKNNIALAFILSTKQNLPDNYHHGYWVR